MFFMTSYANNQYGPVLQKRNDKFRILKERIVAIGSNGNTNGYQSSLNDVFA